MTKQDSEISGTNPLIGVFPEDTLGACCSMLAYLQAVQPRDVLSDQEIFGLQNIHSTIERALSHEIARITTYRLASNQKEHSHG